MKLLEELLRVKPWVEGALEYSNGTHLFEDIAAGVMAGRYQLWANEAACAVTEIIVYPRKKVLHVFLAGGDMDGVLKMQESAAEWGRQQGCTGMTLAGREGWKKVLRRFGYTPKFAVLGVDL